MIDRDRFPVDPWRLIDTHYSEEGVGETLFSVGNGYPRPARQPHRGPRRPGARHVHQRPARDLADPSRRAGLRLRGGRADDRQRPRREGHARVRRRRARLARRRRRARVPAHARSAHRCAGAPRGLGDPVGKARAHARRAHRELRGAPPRGAAARGRGGELRCPGHDQLPAAQPAGRCRCLCGHTDRHEGRGIRPAQGREDRRSRSGAR